MPSKGSGESVRMCLSCCLTPALSRPHASDLLLTCGSTNQNHRPSQRGNTPSSSSALQRPSNRQSPPAIHGIHPPEEGSKKTHRPTPSPPRAFPQGVRYARVGLTWISCMAAGGVRLALLLY